MGYLKYSWLVLTGVLFGSCASTYRPNILFNIDKSTPLAAAVQQAEGNYTVRKNDFLTLEVFTNLGERIVDPGFNGDNQQNGNFRERNDLDKYLVDQAGIVKFPLVGELKVEGLNLRQAEEILQKEYSKFYQQPFVMLRYANKRAVVLGAVGGHVIPLENENMRLTEVLAMARGLSNDSKANNIRVLRGKEIYVVNLTSINGYLNQNLVIQPDDVIYIEPVRRPVLEFLRDYSPLITLATSLTTLVVVLFGIQQ